MKIAIAGYGIEGKANYDYWSLDGNELVIVDERSELRDTPEGASLLLGDGVFSRLDDFDMVIRTAGLPPRKIKTNGIIWTSTNEFLAKCPAQVIGVTGTKGKGTTSSLIVAMLKEAGFTVHLLGNIGVSPLTALPTIQPDDIVVFEMSSFQLWDADKSPHIAVITPIEVDHLDVHDNYEDYVAAKANITRFQTTEDVVIANADSVTAQSIALTSFARQLSYPSSDAGHVANGKFFVGETEICSISELKLPGKHNVENTCAALTAAWLLTHDVDALALGIAIFTGLDHRLKFAGETNSVRYYDDSIATTPGSAIAAVRAFGEPKVLILGGKDKGGEYEELMKLCQSTNTQIVTMGENGQKLSTLASRYGVAAKYTEGAMNEAVEAASRTALPGGVVLLSPAASSFDQYTSYAARGDAFIAAVANL
jgi:UDP-N-acetylmuramoylalanine--D-glutamate ligase